MAIYHLHVKNISRRHGRSVVAAAAYRAGETLPNEAEERLSKFGGRRDVLHAEIRLPAGAPGWMADRARLWNAVEAAERRKDARLAKEIEFALPRELPPQAWLAVARRMADAYTARGVVVDFAVHDDGLKHNPHVHMLLTTRGTGLDGFGAKLRDNDAKQFVTEARALWAAIANEALGKVGAAVEIDARSNAARGLDPSPAHHRGPDPDERRQRRAVAAARREDSMSRATDFNRDAYRAVLGEDFHQQRYPALSQREDWPPASREMAPDLSAQEQREHRDFWHDVDRAAEVLEIVRTPPEMRDPARMPTNMQDRLLFDRLESQRVARESVEKYRAGDLTADSLREWQELENRLHARMQAEGYEPGNPRDWHEVQESMAAFREKLVELRTLEEENRRYRERFEVLSREQARDEADRYPVPGPDRNPVSQRELDGAQERMIADVGRPLPDTQAPPRWLDEAQGRMVEEMERPEPESDRDYLMRRLAQRGQQEGPEPEREPDRER